MNGQTYGFLKVQSFLSIPVEFCDAMMFFLFSADFLISKRQGYGENGETSSSPSSLAK